MRNAYYGAILAALASEAAVVALAHWLGWAAALRALGM